MTSNMDNMEGGACGFFDFNCKAALKANSQAASKANSQAASLAAVQSTNKTRKTDMYDACVQISSKPQNECDKIKNSSHLYDTEDKDAYAIYNVLKLLIIS